MSYQKIAWPVRETETEDRLFLERPNEQLVAGEGQLFSAIMVAGSIIAAIVICLWAVFA